MPSGVSHVASSTLRPVASSNAFAQSSAGRRRAGRPSSTVAEVGDRRSCLSLPAARARCGSTSRASHPAKTYPSTPSTSRSGLPASQTCVAPAVPQLGGQRRRPTRRSPCRCRRCRRPSSPPRRSPRRRRRTASRGRRPGTGCRRTTPGRCAGRSGRSWPGRPRGRGSRRRPRRAAPRTPAAARTRGQPAGRQRARRPARASGSFSARFGNSLTPVIASVRVASRVGALVPGGGDPLADQPGVQRRDQPAGPLDLGEPGPRRLRERRRSATRRTRSRRPGRARGPGGPPRPAGSGCCGRSGGRRRRAGPSAASNGCTVTTSAPPTPAAKQATVVRSRFTHGSCFVVITDEVTACCRWPRDLRRGAADLADPVPQPAGGAQRGDRRELVGGRARSGTPAAPNASSTREPALGERPQVGDAGGERAAELLDRRGAGVGEDGGVDDDACAARRARRPGGRRRPAPERSCGSPVAAWRPSGSSPSELAGRQVGAALDQVEERLGGRAGRPARSPARGRAGRRRARRRARRPGSRPRRAPATAR